MNGILDMAHATKQFSLQKPDPNSLEPAEEQNCVWLSYINKRIVCDVRKVWKTRAITNAKLYPMPMVTPLWSTAMKLSHSFFSLLLVLVHSFCTHRIWASELFASTIYTLIPFNEPTLNRIKWLWWAENSFTMPFYWIFNTLLFYFSTLPFSPLYHA